MLEMRAEDKLGTLREKVSQVRTPLSLFQDTTVALLGHHCHSFRTPLSLFQDTVIGLSGHH